MKGVNRLVKEERGREGKKEGGWNAIEKRMSTEIEQCVISCDATKSGVNHHKVKWITLRSKRSQEDHSKIHLSLTLIHPPLPSASLFLSLASSHKHHTLNSLIRSYQRWSFGDDEIRWCFRRRIECESEKVRRLMYQIKRNCNPIDLTL